MEYEMHRISKNGGSFTHKKKLEQLICNLGKEQGLSTSQIVEYTDTLCNNAPLINSRLHYALLCKKTSYTPTLESLYKAYTTKSSR